MGYTVTDKCIFDLDMPFTENNLRYVISFSGWTVKELVETLEISFVQFGKLKNGMDDGLWRRVLDVCGRRTFDAESEGDLA